MALEKKKIKFKEKVHPRWEDVVTAAINGADTKAVLYAGEGELYLPVGDENMWSIVIKKDGTWALG